jgi:hypothetical protein
VVVVPAVVAGLAKLNKPLPAVVPLAGVVPEVPPSEKTGKSDYQVESRRHCT